MLRRRFGERHAAFGARLNHARHLETAERFPQDGTAYAERCGEFVFVGDAAARTQSLFLEVLNQLLFHLVYEGVSASVNPKAIHTTKLLIGVSYKKGKFITNIIVLALMP